MPRKESTRIYYQINNDKMQYKGIFLSRLNLLTTIISLVSS